MADFHSTLRAAFEVLNIEQLQAEEAYWRDMRDSFRQGGSVALMAEIRRARCMEFLREKTAA